MSDERPFSEHSWIVDGAARFHDLLYVIVKDKELQEQSVEHARFIAYDRGEVCHNHNSNWNSPALCIAKYPEEKMVAVGEDGDVVTFVAGAVTEETLDPQPKVIRNVQTIDGYAYACGLGREVYVRQEEDHWIPIGVDPTNETVGFESIDGFNQAEIYAVGLKGEIWNRMDENWTQSDSPTNLILTGVCCAADGNVYICGQHGTLIVGRNDSWSQIDLEDVEMDFWDVHWFRDKLYIASMQHLFTYTEKSGLELVDFGKDQPSTCYRLTSAENVLWSVGSQDIFSLVGTEWARCD